MKKGLFLLLIAGLLVILIPSVSLASNNLDLNNQDSLAPNEFKMSDEQLENAREELIKYGVSNTDANRLSNKVKNGELSRGQQS